MIRHAALLLALLSALPAAAEIYSWKDKDGRTHYSDVPPPTGEVKVLRAAPPPVRPPQPAPAEAASTQPNEAARNRLDAEPNAATKAAEEKAQAEERQRFCEQARGQLILLRSGQRIWRMNANGEREFVDDATRSEEATRLEQQVEQICN